MAMDFLANSPNLSDYEDAINNGYSSLKIEANGSGK